VERTVSNVTGDFKDRLATYALNSPEGRGLDKTLTPVPEVVLQQTSPSQRRSHGRHEPQESDDDEEGEVGGDGDATHEDEANVDKDGEDEISDDGEDVPVRTRRDKRTLATIVTPSQLERIIGPPSKKARSEEPRTPPPPPKTKKVGTFQKTLTEHFARRAGVGEANRRGDDGLDLLSPEQVTSLLSKVATGDVNDNEDDEEMEEQEQEDEDEMPDERSSQGPEECDEDEIEGEVESMDIEEEVQQPNPEDADANDPLEDAPEDNNTTIPAQKPTTPTKSERNLFKSRRKNEVHTLHTTTPTTLSHILTQHTSLRKPHHPSRRGQILSKEYTLSNEKAEERLSLTVSKEDFARMRIVGQFNLGFIIAVREREEDEIEDVFIIDQHASDEKFNFERLQAETVMQVQALARYLFTT